MGGGGSIQLSPILLCEIDRLIVLYFRSQESLTEHNCRPPLELPVKQIFLYKCLKDLRIVTIWIKIL